MLIGLAISRTEPSVCRRRNAFCRTALLSLLACTAQLSIAQTFNSLTSFQYFNGSNPLYVSLVQGFNGNYYGTTKYGGATGEGEVFEVTPGGTVTTLYSFCPQAGCTDGQLPNAGLWLATNGNFYGTTQYGGANNGGTIFQITATGALTTLYNFCSQPNCTDGGNPQGGIIQATNGNFYGMTSGGGGAALYGAFYDLTRAGKFTTLAYLGGTGGSQPVGTLVQATNGNFYGTAEEGGSAGHGTIFEVSPSGRLTVLYNFCSQPGCSDGSFPVGALLQASNGNLYGTASGNGVDGQGTLFVITPGGKFSVLYTFCSLGGCADGAVPYGTLIQATDRNIYGTTTVGGSANVGTVFQITKRDKLTTLHNFDTTDGSWPIGLVQGTDGSFYGTTEYGGVSNVCNPSCGTVFNLSMGLGAFVETLPNSGKVGAVINILGNNLTSASSVSFSGTNAPFRVVSSSQIETSIPAGATTGTVQVTLSGGTLNSNSNFRVLPQIKSFTPTSGPVGTVVTISGVSLTQTKVVGFGDTVPSQFTVNSDTQVTATLPNGAKTGPVGIETLGGIGISSQIFTVTP